MVEMTRIERVVAVLAGEQPDRPPVSFWHHFPPDCQFGQAAIDAHLKQLARFDLDFLKVMNDNPYPTQRDVCSAGDLRDLPVLRGDEEGYGRQLELIRALSAELGGKVLLITTLFNAWTILRRVVVPRTSDRHNPPSLAGPPRAPDKRITELLRENRGDVGMAIDAIAASQANFAKRCIEAGADGVFLSVRDDWVDTDENGLSTYDEMVRIGDGQIIMAAAGGSANLLHVCGTVRDFDSFAAYPVHAINWADRAAGPSIAEAAKRTTRTLCGGVDNLSTLRDGTPAEVEAEARDALRQAGDRPMILAPGCTFDPDRVPEANLDAMVRAVRPQ